jgi:hypothetical protein
MDKTKDGQGVSGADGGRAPTPLASLRDAARSSSAGGRDPTGDGRPQRAVGRSERAGPPSAHRGELKPDTFRFPAATRRADRLLAG